MTPALSTRTCRPAHIAGFSVLLTMLLLFSGCSFFNRETEGSQQEPDILATLPDDLQTVDMDPVWVKVNVDGDTDTEFLLVYTYNNSGAEDYDGPVGANIYDLQNNTEQPDRREQSAPSYYAYRLLPNFWAASDTGFIAPPGAYDAITIRTLPRSGAVVTDTLPANVTDAAISTDQGRRAALDSYNSEILICGGDTNITVAWWRNLLDGYGVANIYAPGSFDGVDCSTLTAPLETLDGFEPLHDRSLLCRRVGYARQPDPAGDPARDIVFTSAEKGIDFCRFAPDHAFYPEAVVMAYLAALEDGAAAAADQWTTFADDAPATADFDPATWFADLGTDRLLIGLFGPPTVRYRGSQARHSATVCAEIQSVATGELRAFTFGLQHIVADTDARRTDEWRIASIAQVPAPPDGPAPDCETIVPNGTPGRALNP